MRITPLRIAKMNLVEGYHNKSIFFSIFFPVIFLWFVKQLDASVILSSFVSLSFVFGSLDDALFSFSRERDSGTLAKLFISPASRWSITGGRVISSLLLGILKATLVLLFLLMGDKEVYMDNNPFSLASFYIIASLTISLTVLVGLSIATLCRSSRLTVLLASSIILLLAVPIIIMPVSESNQSNTKGLESMDYNPFWICYRFLDKLIDVNSLLEQEPFRISLLFTWNLALYLIANVVMRRKIA